MEYPLFTFILGILMLMMIDNVLANISKVQVAKYESRKDKTQ
jgi:hypothetical protein